MADEVLVLQPRRTRRGHLDDPIAIRVKLRLC